MYKSIAEEFGVELQRCMFHVIYNNNNKAEKYSKAKHLLVLDKMTIFIYTSQMNEIVRSLSLKDALD